MNTKVAGKNVRTCESLELGREFESSGLTTSEAWSDLSLLDPDM